VSALQSTPVVGEQPPASLRRHRAERRAERIRGNLTGAAAELRAAREDGDWADLGFDSHGAYVLERFGDVLADIRLETEDRRAVVDAMRTAGATHSQIVRDLRVSAGTVANDIKVVGDHAPEKVVGDDGRTRSARAARPAETATSDRDGTPALTPVAGIGRDNRTEQVVTAAGPSGLTVHELCKRGRMKQGAASASLSRLAGAGRLRVVGFRDGCSVYVGATVAASTC
jgi:hypothetical protein